MLFRPECSKINRGPSYRCSIGEFWCCMLFCHLRGGAGRGRVGAIMLFGGFWEDMFMEIWPPAVEEDKGGRRKTAGMMTRAYGGNSTLLPPFQKNKKKTLQIHTQQN